MCATKILVQAAQHVLYMNTSFYVQETVFLLIAHSCSVVMRCGLVLSEEEMSEASGHVRNHKKNSCVSKLNQAVTEACSPFFRSIPDSSHLSHFFPPCGAWTRFRVMASPYATSRSHSDTPHSVRLLSTSDQLDAETSTWQHTTHIRQKERETSMPRRDSNPQSQQASGRRPMP
jgi:hypothetical protein